MIRLTNPATGHEIKVDEQSVEFWQAAGFRETEAKPEAKKATAKRSSARKSSK